MRTVISFASLIVLFLYMGNLFASANEWHGKAEGEVFAVSYKEDERKVHIDSRKEHAKIDLSGYTAIAFYVRDIDGDGNDEIMFLDQAGASVGGELRLFSWIAGKVVEINEEYYANRITLKQLKNKYFVLLWQHDTENLHFCSEVLFFQQGKLLKEASRVVWDEIIIDYKKSVTAEKGKWRKSRYYAYIAMAYQKLGNKAKSDQFLNKARRLDPNNPFVNRGS